jgi:2-iminobutanoate/2-iminopropanoate deaminase
LNESRDFISLVCGGLHRRRCSAARISISNERALAPQDHFTPWESEMDIFFKAVGFLIAIGWCALCSTPVAADTEQVHFYNSPAAAAAKLPFSQAVRVGDVLYLSGAIGVLPGKMELAPGGMEAEAKQMMENIGDVLKANGLTFDDVFKCTAMLADMSKWGAFNKIYVTYFKPEHLPARSALGANGLALGAQVELECWAFARKQ